MIRDIVLAAAGETTLPGFFPRVYSTSSSTFFSSSYSVPIPAGTVSGDLLLAFVSVGIGGASVSTAATGWSKIDTPTMYLGVFGTFLYKTAGSSETAATGALTSVDDCSVLTWRITGWTTTGGSPPFAYAFGTDVGRMDGSNAIYDTTPDPPSVTHAAPSTNSTMWLAGVYIAGSNSPSVTAYPTGYNANRGVFGVNTNSSNVWALSTKSLIALTEDPPTYSIHANPANGAIPFTIAIKGSV